MWLIITVGVPREAGPERGVVVPVHGLRALVWAATGENMPALPAPDWSVVRIYPRLLRLIGPS
eukprot:9000536-Pyramimonas_sp.AAC.1